MTKHCKFIVMASAAIAFAASSMPLQAEGLGGLGKAVGGTLGGLGNAVGNTGGAVGNAVNGVTGKVANTTTKLGTLKARGALSADARSDILNGVRAKARVLSPEELARLCLAAGGGDGGCGSGNKPRILGLIDARLAVLSDKRLIGLCASAGAGCGGPSSIAKPGSIPMAGATGAENAPAGPVPSSGMADNSLPNGANRMVSGMSDRDVVTYKKRCINVLRSPQRYESDIVSLCRLIKRQKA